MSDSNHGYLKEADVSVVVRLLGEVAVMESNLVGKRKYLAEGLSRVLKAQVWFWSVGVGLDNKDGPASYSITEGGWTTPRQRDLFFQAAADPDAYDPANVAMQQAMTCHVTRCHHELVSDEVWHASKHYEKYGRELKLSTGLASGKPTGGHGGFSFIVFWRNHGEPHFSESDRTLLHLVTREVPWLHVDSLPEGVKQITSTLTSRERLVLVHLLAGDGRKQIATRMNLSEHTVNDYLKSLHRHFNVSSRGELLAQFLSGGIPAPRA